MAAVVSCGLALGFFAACGRHHGEPNERGAEDVASRSLTFRPGQGRLVGVDWFQPRSEDDVRARASDLRRNAVEDLPDERDRRAIGGLRADAVVALLSGDADAAIDALSKAVERSPGNAIVRSDLAAALLQRGAAFSDPYDFVLALVAAAGARHLDPESPAIRFNLALALQRLSLYERARAEWQSYLVGERDPDWSQAARSHLAELERRTRRPARGVRKEEAQKAVERGDQPRVRALVARSPQVFREMVEQETLPAWAEAAAAGRGEEARQRLAEAGAIGEALAVKGDPMAADTAAQISRLRDSSPVRLQGLIGAIQDYGRGLTLLGKSQFAEAQSRFERASRQLAAERSPLAGWATYWIAFCRFQLLDYDGALALLHPLLGNRNGERYPALRGRARSLVALIAIIRGDPGAALSTYQSALADHRRLGETAYAAKMVAMAATCRDYLGQRHEAWRELYPALIEPATLELPQVRNSILVVASWLANKEGDREIALWFQGEIVRNALATGIPHEIVEALRGRSEILADLGRREAAAADLEQAKRYLRTMTNAGDRKNLEGNLALTQAEQAGSPQETIEWLNVFIPIHRSVAYHYWLAQAFFLRARAEEALGRIEEAERDFATAIAEFEQQRTKIDNPEDRVSYFDRTREIFDAMVRLQLARGRSAAAFRYSEQARSRVLLGWMLAQRQAKDPVPAAVPGTGTGQLIANQEALRRHLPLGTTVLDYWVLPEKLVIWTLRQDDFQMEVVKVDAKTLEQLVGSFLRELQRRTHAGTPQESFRLYDFLFQPVAKHIPEGDRVVVVPDGPLHGLPFAALRNGRSGRYLIQDHVCSVAPSTGVLIASLRRDEEIASRREPRVLAFLDPAFDHDLFPSLSRLESAQGIAKIFPGSTELSGSKATRRSFLERAGEYEVFHFGGHSLVNPDYPLLSGMLFASEPGDRARGVLYSGDVLTHHFSATRLAVLASCSTAAGKLFRTEGVESLARPFLAAGVPAVVASLWDVNDVRTTELFGRFYLHLRETFDPALALQQTQLESLANGSAALADPRIWGAFELIGSNGG